MACWLAEQGHEVRVVCAPPYYPNWKVDKKYRWPLYRREQWRGVDVWRTPLWVPKTPRGLTRVLHLLSFAISSFPVMLWQIAWRPQVVFTVAPAFVCAPAGLLTASLSHARCWLHLQDFEVDVAFGMGLLKGKLRAADCIAHREFIVATVRYRIDHLRPDDEKLRAKGVIDGKTCYLAELGRLVADQTAQERQLSQATGNSRRCHGHAVFGHAERQTGADGDPRGRAAFAVAKGYLFCRLRRWA